MKKTRRFLIFFLSLFLAGCSENYGRRNYVKDLFFTVENEKYYVKLVYYDFNSDSEHYLEKIYTGDNFEDMSLKFCREGKYDFTLCENLVLAGKNSFLFVEDAVKTARNLELSPTANVICCQSSDFTVEKRQIESISENPLCAFSINNESISGRLPCVGSDGENLGAFVIENGKAVRYLAKNRWQLIRVINGFSDRITYYSRQKNLCAQLDRIDTFFGMQGNTLYIDVNMVLKDCKGIDYGESEEKNVMKDLSEAITGDIENIMKDDLIVRHFKLDWYESAKGKKADDFKIFVNVI